jgi:hypothetical protein
MVSRPAAGLAPAMLALAAGPLGAQHSILFAVDRDTNTRDVGNGALGVGLMTPDEVGIVTPQAGGFYSAAIFLTAGAQHAFIGDLDDDGRYVDAATDAPGRDTDAVFVRKFIDPFPTPSPREVYVSKEDSESFDAGLRDGDVFRYSDQGEVLYFVREAQLLDGFGTPGDIDLNAICQTDAGDLFFSVSDVAPPFGSQGSIFFVPTTAIVYNSAGSISAIATGSVVEIATQAQMGAMVANSGMRTSTGSSVTTFGDVGGLEIDPNGGTWVSVLDGQTYPNLLFTWPGSGNDGAILSTDGGGSIATINGVPLASTQQTNGSQIGLLPTVVGIHGLEGLAVIDERPAPLVLETYPTNLVTFSTTLYTEQQVSGATPGGTVAIFVALGPNAVGGFVPAANVLGGQLFGQLLLPVFPCTVDADGFCNQPRTMPATVLGSGVNVVWQVFDITAFLAGNGGDVLGAPAGMQFL